MTPEYFQQTTTAARAAYWLNAASDSRRFAARTWGDTRRFEIARCRNYIGTARAILRQTGNFWRIANLSGEVTR